ncbi:MAG: Unknown protein [uncultured Thiotrichaceae bacterium]|uniref:Uncharacterized protein n=1 Tax=uncultured Thiotrichaceae bacterium TaxID=298394 RepID=A0A6S6U8M7_9GAMM|nr:MAG: Unknown protein [uncultured Thiotrichaceae bacterium]
MITTETIKAKQQDPSLLQESADFAWILDEKRKYFAETEIECPTDKPAYVTKQLTLEEMDAAVEHEAGRCST